MPCFAIRSMSTDEYPSIVSGVDVEIAWDAETLEVPALDAALATGPLAGAPRAHGLPGESWARARGWLSEDL